MGRRPRKWPAFNLLLHAFVIALSAQNQGVEVQSESP
jgi:hypothetical protein